MPIITCEKCKDIYNSHSKNHSRYHQLGRCMIKRGIRCVSKEESKKSEKGQQDEIEGMSILDEMLYKIL